VVMRRTSADVNDLNAHCGLSDFEGQKSGNGPPVAP
jgi:hypothetical protein